VNDSGSTTIIHEGERKGKFGEGREGKLYDNCMFFSHLGSAGKKKKGKREERELVRRTKKKKGSSS